MVLQDFSSLIQLAAGLNIAFVAVEVSKSYTSILSERIFNVQEILMERFGELKKMISLNMVSIESLKPTVIDGVGTNSSIESAKRDCEKLLERMNGEEDSIYGKINERCIFKSFSGLSLMMFLFCCTVLFMIPFQNHICNFIFTLLVSVYVAVGWMCDDARIYNRLLLVIVTYMALLAASVILSLLMDAYCHCRPETLESINIFMIPMLPYAGFVAFFFKLRSKIKVFRAEVDKSYGGYLDEINRISGKVDRLSSLQKIIIELKNDSMSGQA